MHQLLQETKNAGLTNAEVNVTTTAFSFKAEARDLNFPDGTGLSPRADGMACGALVRQTIKLARGVWIHLRAA